MTAVGHWFRLDVPGRWRSLLVLAFLIAFASGTVMTAVAGARRGATAGDRLWARTLPATVAVLPNQPGFDWEAIRAFPDVAALSPFVVGGYEIDGAPADFAGFPPVGDDEMRTIERPVVLDGRLVDPTRADEVVVSPKFVDHFGKGVGDTVTIGLYTPESLDASAAGVGELSTEGAPVVEATIVGVIRSPWFSDKLGGVGGLAPSPGLYAQYRPNLVGANENVYVNALVRLQGGESAIPRFRADLARVTQRTDIEVWNLAADGRRLSDVTGFEADSLLAFALAAAVAGLFFVGQSVSRYASAVLNDLQVLRTFGMTSGQLRLAAALGPVLASIAGVIAGATVAVAASSRFPIGSASLIEPNPGVDVDTLVISLGLVLVPAFVAAGAVIVATISLRSLRKGRQHRSSSVAAAATRAGLPVPVLVGVRFALEPGRGHRAVPVRAAVLGAVVGVAGVLAALTFAHGVDDATSNPARFGQFPLESFFGFNDVDFVPTEDLLGTIARDDDVEAVNDTRLGVAGSGDQSVAVYSIDPWGEPLDVVVTEGRLPTASGEVTLGPSTADRLGVEIGDSIRLVGTRGEHELAITGIAFLPQSPHDIYSSGAWVTRAGYDRLFEGFKFHLANIQLRPGADPDAVAARLERSIGAALGGEAGGGDFVGQPLAPDQLAELQQVRRLPEFLAGFLVVLALGAVGHALASAVRRRRHDIAVLRVLGLTRREARLIVITQAVVLALVGLVVGTPLGVAVGRLVWQRVADRTPVDYVPPVAVWALMLIAPLALAAANLLAAWPSHRAATLRVAPVLRSE